MLTSQPNPSDKPWWLGDACVIVRVRLAPKSSKDTIDGIEMTSGGPAFRAHVRAVPSEGHANAAIERLLAGWLDVAKSRVALISGRKSRVKTLRVDGSPDELGALLEAKLGGSNNQ